MVFRIPGLEAVHKMAEANSNGSNLSQLENEVVEKISHCFQDADYSHLVVAYIPHICFASLCVLSVNSIH